MRTKFSIITVTYNNVEGLHETITSILEQTYENFEVIVVDGASTDLTIKSFENVNDSRIYFQSEIDDGIYDAQNKGIKRSNGEYLIFLNAGDIFDNPFVLEKVATETSKMYDIIYGNINLRLNDGNIFLQDYPENITKLYWILGKYLCHQVIFFKKDLFESFGLYDLKYKYASDFDFIAKIWFKKSLLKKYINFPFVVYDLQGVSSLDKNRNKIIKEYYEIIAKKFGKLDSYLFILNSNFNFSEKIKKIKNIIIYLFNIIFITFLKGNKNYKLENFSPDSPSPIILHFSTSDSKGGAAQAAYKIHRALVSGGINSYMVVKHKKSNDPRVIEALPRIGLSWLYQRLKIFVHRIKIKYIKLQNSGLLSFGDFSYLDIGKIIKLINPDIVHLHWICYDFISLDDLLQFKKPIVWTLHDMWPFSGAEHVSFKEEYKYGYSTNDLINYKLFQKKNTIYNQLNITPVGVSNWMKKIAAESILFKRFVGYTIPNIVSVDIFFPKNREKVRNYFNFQTNIHYLLFGSDYKDDNKGFDDIIATIKYFDNKKMDNVCFVFFGSVRIEPVVNFVSIINMGYINNAEIISDLYNAVDITLVPSRIESFCLVAAESISCGTPVVCYNTSGLVDIVIDGENGFKASCYDLNEFINYIEILLTEDRPKIINSIAMHKFIADNFSTERIFNSYRQIYETIVI